MNGWEFLEEYKKINKSAAQKPIMIMLTTSIHPNDKKRGATIADVAGFECKPLTAEMIEKVFKTFFSGSNNALINQVEF